MDRMPILTLLLLVAKYLRDLRPLPNWTNSLSVREWARRLIAVLTALTQQTTSVIDDAAVRMAANLVASDEAWEAFWSLVQGMVVREENDPPLVSSASTAIDEIAEKAAIDPATIALILQAIMTIVELFKKRRRPPEPAPVPPPQPAPPPMI